MQVNISNVAWTKIWQGITEIIAHLCKNWEAVHCFNTFSQPNVHCSWMKNKVYEGILYWCKTSNRKHKSSDNRIVGLVQNISITTCYIWTNLYSNSARVLHNWQYVTAFCKSHCSENSRHERSWNCRWNHDISN